MRYRKMRKTEVEAVHSFNDHFRFRFDVRMDRNEAIEFAKKVEELFAETHHRKIWVDLQVPSR